MKRHKLRDVRPGDVFELLLDEGSIALQAIGRHKSHGWAVRVLRCSPERSHGELGWIEDAPELYVVLIGDIAFEESENKVRYIGSARLPERYRHGLPIFRASVSYKSDGRHEPGSWWLDDGEREWRVGELSEAEKHYPFRRFIPALALKDLVERGWDPEWEFKGPGAREFSVEATTADDPSPRSPTFFLVFVDEQRAQTACGQLKSVDLFDSVTMDDVGSYVVSARARTDTDWSGVEPVVERIARDNGGDYDGNEWPMMPPLSKGAQGT